MPSTRKKAAKKNAAPATDVVHVRLSSEAIRALDHIAKENNTTRNAIIQIAVSRTLKSGV